MDLDPAVALAGLLVGFTVGMTGMGGGALMTPIMILIFNVAPLTAVSSDLVVSLVMKPIGGGVHLRRGTVNKGLVGWLTLGSVPSAFAGVLLLRALGGDNVGDLLKPLLGVVLLLAALTMVLKAELQRRRARTGLIHADVPDLTFIPVSAPHGDNVVERGERMPWYGGPPVLKHLEQLHIASDRNLIDVRFPVQHVIRPMSDAHHDYRGYAGSVGGGVLKPGDEVMGLPSGLKSHITSIDTFDMPVQEAFTGMSVIIHLDDDIDISRGDMICRPANQPSTSQDIEALVCWMADQPLREGGRYGIKQTTRWCRAVVGDLRYRLDINTLHRDETATGLDLNEIGRVRLRVTAPLMHDSYRRNRTTGSFILVDESTNATVGAGMILGSGD